MLIIAIVAAGCGGGGGAASDRRAAGPSTTPAAPSTPAPSLSPVSHEAGDRSSYFIRVADQQSDGCHVRVEEAVAGGHGAWIVIHSPGLDILGVSALLPPGTSRNVTVALTYPLRTHDQLLAMLHGDDGNGTFEWPGPDSPVLPDGAQVHAPFEVEPARATTCRNS